MNFCLHRRSPLATLSGSSSGTATARRRRNGSLLAFAAAALTSAFNASAAQGAPPSLSYKDWEVACDNTRTCRAAGYQSEAGNSDPVSILLTRSAGPATAVQIDLQVGGEKDVRGPLSLKAGTAEIRNLGTGVARLSDAQARSLLPQLMRAEQAVVTSGGGDRWVLSLMGLNAVLLKMDDAQGRVDTPGALVKRGGKPEASVLPPLPAPLVKAVRPVVSRPGDAALAARIFPTLDLREAKESCNQAQPIDAKAVTVDRLTDAKVLLSLECGVGAYNDQSFLWIADDKPPYSVQRLDATGDLDGKDGSVTSIQKGRGIGDCVWLEEAHFDGRGFVRTREAGDTLCRGFAGGAWNLPRYVSRVEYAPARR
ncbi:DUF1176 domain-containing protein [Xylophilus sp. Kf1]|nr:DUF1176 domain-containing protein [Xylophilus sp. Kf1]